MFRIKYTIDFVLSYKYFQIREILTITGLEGRLDKMDAYKRKVLGFKLLPDLKPNTLRLKLF